MQREGKAMRAMVLSAAVILGTMAYLALGVALAGVG